MRTLRWPIVLVLVLALGAAVPADAQSLVVDGGFESGTLAGWTRGGPSGDFCAQNWTVASNGGTPPPGTLSPAGGTQCLSVGDPPEGAFAAYTSFDFGGPTHFTLEQSFVVPAGVTGATLGFRDALRWDYEMFSAQPGGVKSFFVRLLDESDAVLLTAYAFSTPADGVGGYDWTARTFDVGAVLAAHPGALLTLQFDADIPEFFVGPGGLGIDDVWLQATTVPEPATAALVATGLLALAGLRRRCGGGATGNGSRG